MLYEVKKRVLLTVEPGSRVAVSPEQLRAARGYLEPAAPTDNSVVDPDELKSFVEGAVSDRMVQLSTEYEARMAAAAVEKDNVIASIVAEKEALKAQIVEMVDKERDAANAPPLSVVPESVYRTLFSRLTAIELTAVAAEIGIEVPDGAKKPDIMELLLKRVV